MFMFTNCFGKEKIYSKEKVAKLHFYVQDLRIGHVNATVSEVATASVTKDSPYDFGSVHILDDLVTAGPEMDSRPVGRVHGLTTNADLSIYCIAMNLNFYFTAGKFAGSQLSLLGRNQVLDDKRELPVVCGTGAFRFTPGYAIQSTYMLEELRLKRCMKSMLMLMLTWIHALLERRVHEMAFNMSALDQSHC